MASSRSSDTRPQVAFTLSQIGLMMIVVFALQVLFGAFPLQLKDPGWMLSNAFNLTNSAPLPLIGSSLILLAHQLDDRSEHLNRMLTRLERLALPVALGFLLLIPLQFYAGFRQIRNAEVDAIKTMADLRKVEQRISGATSSEQLGAIVRNLPGGAQVKVTEANLETIRSSLLQDLQPKMKRLETVASERKQAAIQTSLKDRIFQSLLALAFSSGFAALAFRSNRGGLLKLLAGNPTRRRPDFSDEELLADEDI